MRSPRRQYRRAGGHRARSWEGRCCVGTARASILRARAGGSSGRSLARAAPSVHAPRLSGPISGVSDYGRSAYSNVSSAVSWPHASGSPVSQARSISAFTVAGSEVPRSPRSRLERIHPAGHRAEVAARPIEVGARRFLERGSRRLVREHPTEHPAAERLADLARALEQPARARLLVRACRLCQSPRRSQTPSAMKGAPASARDGRATRPPRPDPEGGAMQSGVSGTCDQTASPLWRRRALGTVNGSSAAVRGSLHTKRRRCPTSP